MRYKLIGNGNTKNIRETILKNRGINNIDLYLNTTEKNCHSYTLLDNIGEGIELIEKYTSNELPIYIVVDCDVDGFCSASIISDYIEANFNKETEFFLHTGKQHGFSNDIMEQIKGKAKGLVIVPDAGTNDTTECSHLVKCGFEILIIDHHKKTEDTEDNIFATIVNNQTSDYPNKELSGTGVTYKFVQALDDYFWTECADNYIDLVAIATIADDMDLRELENKYLVDNGLRNINHPLLKEIIKKQSFSIKDTNNISPYNVSFHIAPLINATIRLGTQEEKELLFRAFAKDESENFEYLPRKSKNNPNPTLTYESIYERVSRLSNNIRNRQSKAQEKAVNEIIEYFDESNKENSICFVNATKLTSVPKSLTGLIAMRIADKYSKPCLVIRRDKNKQEKDNETVTFSGSGRNVRNSIIDDLQSELNTTGLFEYVAGHDNAFGVSIKKENIPTAIEHFNKKYGKSLSEKCHRVDFVFEENIDYRVVREIYGMKNLFSKCVEEPKFYVKNIWIDPVGLSSFSNDKHWKCQVGEIEYIKFNAPENDEILKILSGWTEDEIILNVVGRADINFFGNKAIPQVIIEDYEVVKPIKEG